MEKVVVVGGSGQDGLILTKKLLEAGHQVVATTTSKEGLEKIKSFHPRASAVQIDIRSMQSVSDLFGDFAPTRVFNLAAISSVQESWNVPVEVFETNLLGALNVLEALKQKNSSNPWRLYQASSSEMFGGGVEALHEGSPFSPKSPYAASKLAAHSLMKMYRDVHGLFVCSGILFNHESPLRGEQFLSRSVAIQVAEFSKGLRSKVRVGNLESVRDWGSAKDYVEAMVLIIEADKPDDYVVSSGNGHSVAELVEAAFDSVGVSDWRLHVEIDSDFSRPNDLTISIGDSKKIRNELGWEPRDSFKQMVAEMVTFELSKSSSPSSWLNGV
jgi:GDPmannose 4,6-dehydratase